MCRLYGFRANQPTKVECSLVYAQNALLSQSAADQRGKAHPDGWGIAYYGNGAPVTERRATPAFEDAHFSVTAERVYARSVLAHVRQATVGPRTIENAQPFTHGRWTFAHNGTVRGFERVERRLAAETAPDLWELRCGSTDSEAMFYWLLTRLREFGLDLAAPEPDPRAMVRVVGASIRELDLRSARADPTKPARLSFLLTDGALLLATRWRNPLYWVDRHGVYDCEICGIPHIEHDETVPYRALVVASEPITSEAWEEVPESNVLAVRSDFDSCVVPI
jgi:glutamine amidotransferase